MALAKNKFKQLDDKCFHLTGIRLENGDKIFIEDQINHIRKMLIDEADDYQRELISTLNQSTECNNDEL